jgi:uncharacterized cupin superfamily protein/opacity protein-like surface antigen
MKRILLGSMALAAMIAGPAMAADMPVKVKAPPPVVLYDWSGAYVGFNIGGVWADVDRFYPQAIGGALSATSRTEDVIYGFHAGAQWQWGQWVLGVETSLSAGFREMQGSVALPTPPFAADTSAYNKITNLFTVGPRLGYAWDRFMIYGTGGYASADIKGQYTFTSTGVQRFPAFHGQNREPHFRVRGAGLKHVRVPPGKLSAPPHCHSAEEELFVVLEGDGTLLLGEDEHAVRAGHVVSRPAATGIAHAFRGGPDGLAMLAYGTREPNDIAYYPRSAKVYLRGVGVMARLDALEYWDGEP